MSLARRELADVVAVAMNLRIVRRETGDGDVLGQAQVVQKRLRLAPEHVDDENLHAPGQRGRRPTFLGARLDGRIGRRVERGVAGRFGAAVEAGVEAGVEFPIEAGVCPSVVRIRGLCFKR